MDSQVLDAALATLDLLFFSFFFLDLVLSVSFLLPVGDY